MTEDNKTRNIAMFCDFENIALGVRDAKYDRFDLKAVLGRVLLKGNIVFFLDIAQILKELLPII